MKSQFGATILELAFAAEELAARAAAVLELGVAHRVELDRSIVRLSTQDSAAVLTDALPRLQAVGCPGALLVRDPSLDDVFLALTGAGRASVTEPCASDTAATNRPASSGDRGRCGRLAAGRFSPWPWTSVALAAGSHRLGTPSRVTWRNLIAYPPRAAAAGVLRDPAGYLRADVHAMSSAARSAACRPVCSYVDYLMPGIFVQTAVFGSIITAVGMATDLNNGIIERFRSLPMARPRCWWAGASPTWPATCSW